MPLPAGIAWLYAHKTHYGVIWGAYAVDTADLVETAFTNGSPAVRITSPNGGIAGTGAIYDIDFTAMVQVNALTGFRRELKRVNTARAAPAPPPAELWEYQDDGGAWVPYDADACELLRLARASRRARTTLHLETPRLHAFEIDFNALTQYNARTGALRAIRLRGERGAAAVAAAAAAQPAAAMAAHNAAAAAAAAAQYGHGFGGFGPAAAAAALASGGGDGGGSGGGAAATPAAEVELAEDCTAACADDEACAICLDGFSKGDGQEALRLRRCVPGHYLHRACIEKVFHATGPKCPTCGIMYGTVIGDQPEGTMNVSTSPHMHCSGYPGVGTIVINYAFSSGIQGPKQPHPGQRYSGTSRVAYLPDTPEGREVLALLQRCFQQRLTFTVGTSVTTGIPNCVIWNGVHHKTRTNGGAQAFGYPDPTYFERVKAELAAKGVQ